MHLLKYAGTFQFNIDNIYLLLCLFTIRGLFIFMQNLPTIIHYYYEI